MASLRSAMRRRSCSPRMCSTLSNLNATDERDVDRVDSFRFGGVEHGLVVVVELLDAQLTVDACDDDDVGAQVVGAHSDEVAVKQVAVGEGRAGVGSPVPSLAMTLPAYIWSR